MLWMCGRLFFEGFIRYYLRRDVCVCVCVLRQYDVKKCPRVMRLPRASLEMQDRNERKSVDIYPACLFFKFIIFALHTQSKHCFHRN